MHNNAILKKFHKISNSFVDSLSVSFKFSLLKWHRLLSSHEEYV